MRPPLPWEEAALPVLTEAEAALWERALGRHAVQHRGRWWTRIAPGFYQPVCLLAGLTPEEASRPTAWCWGYRGALAPEHAGAANAAIPLHLLPDLPRYGLERLHPTQRSRVRRALREFEIVALRSPDLLLEQGHALIREAHARNPGVRRQRRAGFERWVRAYFEPAPRGLALAALAEGRRLLAFNMSYAVDGVAYGDAAYAGALAMRHSLAAALFHAFATLAARERPRLHSLAYGLHARENQGLCDFKQRLGLEVRAIPARLWLVPAAETVLWWRRPHSLYRLTGRA